MNERVAGVVLVVALVWTTVLDALLAPVGKFGYLPVTVVVIVGLTTLIADRLPLVPALLMAIGVSAGWAELVNLVSGDTSGPVARCAAVVAVGTSSAAVLARRTPAAVMLVMVVVAGGSDWLHARASTVVVVAAVSVTILGVAAIAATDLARAARRADPVAVAVAVAACGVAAAVTALHPMPSAGGDGRTALGSHPGSVSGPSRASQGPPSVPTLGVHHHGSHWPGLVLLTACIVLGVALLSTALRCLVVRLSWRSSRRQLAGGSGAQSAAGAWRFAVARLQAAGYRVPAGLTPDVAAAGRGDAELPGPVGDALRRLGIVVTPAAFGGGVVADAVSAEAWRLAQGVSEAGSAAAGIGARLRMLVAAPAGLG